MQCVVNETLFYSKLQFYLMAFLLVNTAVLYDSQQDVIHQNCVEIFIEKYLGNIVIRKFITVILLSFQNSVKTFFHLDPKWCQEVMLCVVICVCSL
jgi:hypothetical protein